MFSLIKLQSTWKIRAIKTGVKNYVLAAKIGVTPAKFSQFINMRISPSARTIDKFEAVLFEYGEPFKKEDLEDE